MAKWVFDQWDNTMDYPTLGFVAEPGDILDAVYAPDARWSVNADQGAAETVERYATGSGSTYVEPTDGFVLTYDAAQNKNVPKAPADNALLRKYLSATYVAPVNVRAYGATGDGTTDDTAAIQAAINVSTGAAPRAIYFPNGTYKITAELLIPASAHGTILQGESRAGVVIKQYTNAVPIIAMRSEMLHSVEVRDLSVEYVTQQTAAGACAFYYAGPGAGQNNFYQHIYENLSVKKATRAWSVSPTGGTAQSLWSSTWTNINALLTSGSVFYLSRGTGAPSNVMKNIGIYNTLDPTLTPTEPTFDFRGAVVKIDGCSVEGWAGRVFYLEGGADVSVRNLSIEAFRFTTSIASVCLVQASSTLDIEHWGFNGTATTANDTWAVFLRSGSALTCSLRRGKYTSTLSGGTAYLKELVYTSDEARVIVEDCRNESSDLAAPGIGGNKLATAKLMAPRRTSATRKETANYVLRLDDDTVIADGTSLTVTLPDALTAQVGKTYTVKNVHATAVTVNAGGFPATIDGAASKSLAQWAVGRYMSDGSNWITV